MKKIIFILSLLSSVYSFGQCDEYYINELISGPEDRYFPTGSEIRFCPKLKGVALNGYDFDVSQWQGISTQYLTLTKNGGIAGSLTLSINERTLKVNLNGSPGIQVYSISLSSSEYDTYLEDRRKKEKERQEKEKLTKDNIEIALKNNKYFEAFSLLSNSKISDPTITKTVLDFWKVNEVKIDSLYNLYVNHFPIFKSENRKKYNENQENFLRTNREKITNEIVNIEGLNYKALSSSNYEKYKEKFVYLKMSEKIFVYPLGYTINSYFDINYSDKIEFKLDANPNYFEPSVLFYKNGKIVDSLIAVNPISFTAAILKYDYPTELEDLIQKYNAEHQSNYLNEKYPKLNLILNNSIIKDSKFNLITRPKDAYEKNIQIDEYTKLFETLNIKSFLPRNPDFLKIKQLNYQQITLHPKLNFELRNILIKNNFDSVALVYSSHYHNFSKAPNLTIGIPTFDGKYKGGFYFYPIQSGGGIELIKDKDLEFIKFNYTNGKFELTKIDKLIKCYSLSDLEIDKEMVKYLKKQMKKNSIYYRYVSFDEPPIQEYNNSDIFHSYKREPVSILPNNFFISDNIVVSTLQIYIYQPGQTDSNKLYIPYPSNLNYLRD